MKNASLSLGLILVTSLVCNVLQFVMNHQDVASKEAEWAQAVEPVFQARGGRSLIWPRNALNTKRILSGSAIDWRESPMPERHLAALVFEKD